MENQKPQQAGVVGGSELDAHPVTVTPLNETPTPSSASSPKKIRFSWGFVKIAAFVALGVLILVGGVYAFKVGNDKQTSKLATQPSDNFGVQDIPLKGLTDPNSLGLSTFQSLSINGQLRANNSLIIAPTARPTQASTGQIYYDNESNGFAYFDGTKFVNITDADDIAGLQAQLNQLTTSVSQAPQLPSDIARQASDNQFTGYNLFEGGLESTSLTLTGGAVLQGSLSVNGATNLSSLNVNGATTLGPTTASSLVLSSPLAVGSGGTGVNSFTTNGILLGQGSSPLSTVSAAGPGLCLVSTAGAPSFQACPGGGGAVVDSLNGLTGPLTLLNASGAGSNITIDDASTVAKGIASFNATNFSVAAGAVNTIQNISVTSTPTFAGLTLNGNLTVGANGIVTSGATIGSAELDVLDGGISELEVSGVITDVTAGNGLTGDAASGNASLNIVSANGGILVNADNIALVLQPTGDALSGTTSSGSGLEILTSGLSLLQGCSDGQILKWNEVSDTWGCAADAGGSGVGDDVLVNGLDANGANFINTVASGSSAGLTWNLNTTPSPDEVSISISNASATEAGVVTTGIQSFAGDKTYNNTVTVAGLFSANGGVTIETGDTFTFNGDAFTDLSGTGLLVAGGVLQASLGTSIESSEITDLTITGADIANDTITDTQLAFDTGQNLTVTSTPTFAGITLNGNLSIGTNSIVTSGATISSAELDVLDGGISEGEVTGVITDVTAGTGLTGGAASGNATVNIASANGGIVVNADDIALMLQPTGDALSATTSSGSGLEILSTGLSLLQGCSDGEILKWNETTDTWGCASDAGSGGLGDDISVNSSAATNANFIDTVASGSTAGVAWTLNTTPSPDDVSITISNASGTQAGVVTTGVQSFAGDKTFNNAATITGLFSAIGGVTIETGDTFTFNGDAFTDLSGTGLTVAGGVLQASLGTSIDSAEIDDLAITGADIADDTIALGTKTTGDYVAGNTAGTGIAVTGTAGEGWSPTISLDYSADLSTNTLGVNQSSFAATGILFEGSTADAFETLFTLVDPTADNTITIPNASGTLCLSTGNCAGAGSGVTTSGGSTNRLAKFTGSQAINDSTITDDGTNVTTTVNMIIQGGNVTAGTNSQLGSFILNDGNGQTTSLRAGDSVGNLTFILPTEVGSQYQCLKYDTAGQLIWDDCDGGSGGGSGVTDLNGLAGSLAIQGNTQIGVSASNPNINLSINANSIGDSELAFDTGQNLTSTSTPTFAGITLNGNLSVGTNSIVTSGATISSGELDVLDAGITELEVSGVITDVTAGSGLTGGAASGNATLNITSANGGIVVGADDIALTLQPAGDGLSATTSSGSGLEILSGGFALIQGCSDGQILKWNEATDTWGCGADAGGTGLGDDISVGGADATNANFINTTADATNAGIIWALNTTPSPDEISLTVSAASATLAGIVTNGVQSFGGVKTFGSQIVASGGIDLGTQTLQGTTGVIDFSNFDVLANGNTTVGGTLTVSGATTLNANLSIGSNSIVTSGATISSAELDVLDAGITELEVSGVITDVTAGSGLTGGAASGNASVNVASANGGIVVGADSIALTLQPAGDALSSTTSSGSGLEVLSGGLALLQGCGDAQILKWNETSDTWSCGDDAGGTGLGDDVLINGTNATNANFINTTASGTTAGVTWSLNTTPSPDDISLTVSNASATVAGVVTTGAQTFAGDKTFNNALTIQGNTVLGSDAADTLSVNAVSTFNENITVAGGKTLTLTGGITGSRPSCSSSDGKVYYDTDTDQLLVCANNKWQADRSDAIIVAASNSTQRDKDAADYVADGNTVAAADGDQVQINAALTAASGRKVVLLAGTYVADATILVPNNTTLSGVGRGTLIELADLDLADNLIENTDTTTGTNIAIRDMQLNGRKDLNTSGTQRGISLSGMGGGTGSGARQGARVTSVFITDFRSENVLLTNSSNNIISDITSQASSSEGLQLTTSSNNVITGSNFQGNTSAGLNANSTSTGNNIASNHAQGNGGAGFSIASGTSNTLSSNTAIGNQYGFFVSTNSNTITGNTAQGNSSSGIYVSGANSTVSGNAVNGGTYGLNIGGDSNDVTGNTTTGNSYGIFVSGNSNTVNGNNVSTSSVAGINLNAANTNIVSSNRIHDSGAATANNAISLTNSDSNTISDNAISDTSATTTNYAIAINNTSDTNYLSGNTLGTGSINDLGIGTVHAGQVNVSGNYVIQPAGTIELMKDTNVTGALNVTGNVDTNGSLTVGNANQFVISNTGVVTSGTWQGGVIQDSYVADDLTIGVSGTVDWQALNNYPAACGAGQAVTQLGDTITCTAFAASSGSGSYIQNQGAAPQSAQFWINGTSRIDNDLTVSGDVTAGTLLTDTIQSGIGAGIAVQDSIAIIAGKSLTISGGNTVSRPASPTEGMIYFDTDTDKLLVYSNGKWQADRSPATRIIAPSNASQAAKDSADVVLTGTADQTLINTALTAAAGGKVYILAGTVTVTDSISIPNNTTLAGEGDSTLITIPNSLGAGVILITNSDVTTGTGVVIRDLRLDGNRTNQGVFTMTGIQLSSMGGGSGASARQGGRIVNVQANNFVTDGIYLNTSAHITLLDNSAQGNGNAGFNLSGGSYITLANNSAHGNSVYGFYLTSDFGVISDNTAEGNVHGFYLDGGTNNTLTGNTATSNTSRGFALATTSNDNTLTGNTATSNINANFYLNASSNNTLTGNTSSGSTTGFSLNTGSTNNTLTGNTATVAGTGFSLSSSSRNVLTGNTASTNTSIGIYLNGSSNNTVSGNKLHDNGNATANNAILLSGSDTNTITGNNITDTSATTTNYAIDISDTGSDANYLSDNSLGTGSIRDLSDATGGFTVYGGQLNSSANYVIQPAGTVELMNNTNVTGTLNVTSNVDTNGSLTVGNANQFVISNTGVVTSGTWNGSAVSVQYGGTGATTLTANGILFGNGTGAVGVTAAGTTGQCLLATTGSAPTWGTCTATNLQGTYNASSPATIDLSDNKNFTINAADTATDSSIVFNLQCVTCSASGGRFAIQDAGVDIFTVNPNGDIVIGTASNNVTFVASNGYKSTATGTARNSKKIRLHAEYPSVVLDPGSGTLANTGTMTSKYDNTNRMSYYNWTTTQLTAQDYDIVVQVPLPKDFSAWDGNTPVTVSVWSSTTAANSIQLQLLDSAGSAPTGYNFVDATPGSTSTWTSFTPGTTISGTYTDGDYITLRLRLKAPTGGNIRVGNITLNYLSKF